MTTNNEAAALKEITEKHMYGDLLKFMTGELRQLTVPWSTLPEKDQQKVLDRMKDRTEKTVRECVRIIAGKARPTVQADIESVLFKDGVKVTLSFSKSAGDRHAIADSAGGTVLLILPQYDQVLGGEPPKAEKDQRDMLPADPSAPKTTDKVPT